MEADIVCLPSCTLYLHSSFLSAFLAGAQAGEKMGCIYTALRWYLRVFCIMASYRICTGDGELNTSANSSSSSAPCGLSMECASLGNISYPFWDSASCAASPSYVLSNCSSSYTSGAQWDSLSLALQAATTGDSPRPAVITGLSTGLSAKRYITDQVRYGRINLTWDSSLPNLDICQSLFSTHNLSQYNIPASINLTGFANDEFVFSGGVSTYFIQPEITDFENTYLFLNCTNRSAMLQFIKSSTASSVGDELWEEESAFCSSYKEICSNRLYTTSCISLRPDAKVVMLQHIMDTLACSYFTFGISTRSIRSSITPRYLKTGLVQLSWFDHKCDQCDLVHGVCIYDVRGKLSHCGCGKDAIDSNTQTCRFDYYAKLLKRERIFEISVILGIVLVPVILAIVLVFLGIRYFGKIKKGLRGLSSRLARLAISVLKKVLRRLQQSTYRPNLSIILRELEGLTERPVEYSYSSIASATKSFSHVVGEGGFGVVYKGTLPQCGRRSTHTEADRRMEIAVKVLEMRSKHMKKQFLNEVGTIGRIHHVNVVRLLGFCVQEDHEMLVYEYVTNGSLDRWLFASKDGEVDVEERMLDWSSRYAIALGIARGLSYLHEECRHRTIHCDIKPQNILLDDAMSPKIADFGLSRLMSRDESQVVTLARGTPGYMAPEFWMGGESRLSTKFDVYSYGMVLLELISGRRNFAYDDVMGSVCCFPAVAFEAAMESNVAAILDARLGSMMQASAHVDADEAQRNQIWTVAFVALWCIQDHPANRPSMSEVVQYLEGTIAIPKNPPQPSISTTPSLAPFPITSLDRQDFTPISVGR